MTMTAERNAIEVIAAWRAGDVVDGGDNPAGPLFSGGEYAEQEVTMTGGSGRCGTVCTYSATRECC